MTNSHLPNMYNSSRSNVVKSGSRQCRQGYLLKWNDCNDASSDSSSDSSTSSPPRKRSWKKLHSSSARLVLGRKNYLEPAPYLGETGPNHCPFDVSNSKISSRILSNSNIDVYRNIQLELSLPSEVSDKHSPSSSKVFSARSNLMNSVYPLTFSPSLSLPVSTEASSKNEHIVNNGQCSDIEGLETDQKSRLDCIKKTDKSPKKLIADELSHFDNLNRSLSFLEDSSINDSSRIADAENSCTAKKQINGIAKYMLFTDRNEDGSTFSENGSMFSENAFQNTGSSFRRSISWPPTNGNDSCLSKVSDSTIVLDNEIPKDAHISHKGTTIGKRANDEKNGYGFPSSPFDKSKNISKSGQFFNSFNVGCRCPIETGSGILKSPPSMATTECSVKEPRIDSGVNFSSPSEDRFVVNNNCWLRAAVDNHALGFGNTSAAQQTADTRLDLNQPSFDTKKAIASQANPRKLEVSQECSTHDPGLVDCCPNLTGLPKVVNFESDDAEKHCNLTFCKPISEMHVLHAQHCNFVSEGVILRKKFDRMWKPISDIDNSSLDLVFESVCREFILESSCSKPACSKEHAVKSEIGRVLYGLQSDIFKMVFKWFVTNSRLIHIEVALAFLSTLRVGYDADLHSLLLCFSHLIQKTKRDFQQHLGAAILNKMFNLVNIPANEAIEQLLVFNVTRETETDSILNLLAALGIFNKENGNFFTQVSIVWHLNSNVNLPVGTIVRILAECSKTMPGNFSLVRDRIGLEISKLPRDDAMKHFPAIDRFLNQYYCMNSKLAVYLRAIKIHHKVLNSIEQTFWTDNYRSFRIKLDDINYEWPYWDLEESRRNGFLSVVGNCGIDLSKDPLSIGKAGNLKVEEVKINCSEWNDLSSILDAESGAARQIHKTEPTGSFDVLVETLSSSSDGSKIWSSLNILYSMFSSMDIVELRDAISSIVKLLPPHSSYSRFPSFVRKSFVSTINDIVVACYKRRDFSRALELIKTLQLNGESPFENTPNNMERALFEIVCSHVYLECFMVKDAVQILLYSECMNSLQFKFGETAFKKHFCQLEMLVFKILKHCLAARESLHALQVFKAVVNVQKNLTNPMNVVRYYEPVLCSAFNAKTKGSRFLSTESVSLYVLVDRLCGNSISLHPMTYRSILIELHDANVSEDIIRRTLQCCIFTNVYPVFKNNCISLGCHLTTEEMYLYILHHLRYFSSQNADEDSPLEPLSIELKPFKSELPRSPLPVIERLRTVSTDLADSFDRLKKALELLFKGAYSELNITNTTSFNYIVLPSDAVARLLEVVK